MTNSSIVGSTFFGIDLSTLAVQLSGWSRRLSRLLLLLEFGNNCLRLSETSITPNGIQLNHISRVELPAEAFERGVPADPIKMAALLQEICREKKIRAHRAAVVLPPAPYLLPSPQFPRLFPVPLLLQLLVPYFLLPCTCLFPCTCTCRLIGLT